MGLGGIGNFWHLLLGALSEGIQAMAAQDKGSSVPRIYPQPGIDIPWSEPEAWGWNEGVMERRSPVVAAGG